MKKKAIVILLVVLALLVVMVVGGYLILKARYPLEYQGEIWAAADKYDLDPYLICAVVWTESRFQKDSVSSAGAVGLMQLMPDTANWIAGKMGGNVNPEKLTDPKTNIELGCWYLDFLQDRFHDRDEIAAAYNAGHNRVSQWLGDGDLSSDGKQLDDIPFEETKNYVARVNTAYDIYKMLYG